MSNTSREANPLMDRKNHRRNVRLGGVAAAALLGATLFLSAAVNAETSSAPQTTVASAQQTPADSAATEVRPARQVRVIQMWNTPKNQ